MIGILGGIAFFNLLTLGTGEDHYFISLLKFRYLKVTSSNFVYRVPPHIYGWLYGVVTEPV